MSLLEISKLPTAENSAIHLHPNDNVAIARVPLSAGQTLKVGPFVVEKDLSKLLFDPRTFNLAR